jgi:KDO2-lipid IV(A) lauroyltransferase
MEHFVQLGSEIFFTTREIHAESWVRRVRTDAFEQALDVMMSGRPVLLVTGHLGNWELLGYWLATVGVDIDALARPIDNPLINNWLLGVRERQGMRIITKWGATERMAEVVREGGLLGFIGDQNAGDKGIFVPFFNRLASAYKSVGLFALRFRIPIICGYAIRVGNGFQYQVGINDIIEPDIWEAQPDPLYYLTARYTLALENQVRMAPDQYLWIHRRWKSRPRHEREGKPMPDALRSKLQALPWMTDEQMAELQKPIPPEKRR